MTIVETTFDKNGSLEIGLKLLKTEGSRIGFFKSGCTTACLKIEGNRPSSKELLMIIQIMGLTVSMTSLRE